MYAGDSGLRTLIHDWRKRYPLYPQMQTSQNGEGSAECAATFAAR